MCVCVCVCVYMYTPSAARTNTAFNEFFCDPYATAIGVPVVFTAS